MEIDKTEGTAVEVRSQPGMMLGNTEKEVSTSEVCEVEDHSLTAVQEGVIHIIIVTIHMQQEHWAKNTNGRVRMRN